MDLKIFRDAYGIYQSCDVNVLGLTSRTVAFMIKDVEVRVVHTDAGIKFCCGCEAHLRHMAQDKLCKRSIAALVYISKQKKFIKSGFVGLAKLMSTPSNIWLKEADKTSALFEVGTQDVWIERIPTGTRVRTNKNKKVIQDKFTLEMLAVILYTYERRGKLKKWEI